MPKEPKNYKSEPSHLDDGDWDRIWRERIEDKDYYKRPVTSMHSFTSSTSDGNVRTVNRHNFGAGAE